MPVVPVYASVAVAPYELIVLITRAARRHGARPSAERRTSPRRRSLVTVEAVEVSSASIKAVQIVPVGVVSVPVEAISVESRSVVPEQVPSWVAWILVERLVVEDAAVAAVEWSSFVRPAPSSVA